MRRITTQRQLFARKGQFTAWSHRRKRKKVITAQCDWCGLVKEFEVIKDLRAHVMALDTWIMLHKCIE